MKFHTLSGLFARFYEVRDGLRSSRTNCPMPEMLREEGLGMSARQVAEIVEARRSFVSDVQLYLKRLDWYETLILLGRMVPPDRPQVSWRRLAKLLREASRNRPYPRYLNDHSNLAREYTKRIKPAAERHFRATGYLWREMPGSE